MPPVLGPRSPSQQPLVIAGRRQGQDVAAVADGDDAGLAAVQALLTTTTARTVAPDAVAVRTAADRRIGLAASWQTVTPLPAASPSALTTTPRPSPRARGRSAIARSTSSKARAGGHPARRPPRRPRGRTPCCSRSAPRPQTARSRRRQPRGARPPRRPPAVPRADHRQLDRAHARPGASAGAIERVDIGRQPTRDSVAMPRCRAPR